MLLLLNILLGATAVLILLPTAVLFVEVVSAGGARSRDGQQPGPRPPLAIIMPAHNEAVGIAETLRSVVPQLMQSDRLIVVADNCSDTTAAVATAEGAEVLVRSDTDRRGKGYALDFGVRFLAPSCPPVVMIIDADCKVGPGAIDALARACAKTARPVQALYLMHAPQGADVKTRVAEFAWLVKNQVRPTGLWHLGLPCQLMGTGMAFPRETLAKVNLATGHIVEDLKLGIELTRAGSPPLFCPEALVTSYFPTSSEGIQTQRTRWEHGYLSVILGDAPRLLRDSLAAWNGQLLGLTLDLIVPPVALLCLLVAAMLALDALFYYVTGSQFPLVTACVAAALLGTAVMVSWRRYGRHVISPGTLLLAGGYALWKIPLYAKFLVSRQIDWVRSKRQ